MIYLIHTKEYKISWERVEKDIINFLSRRPTTLYMTTSLDDAQQTLRDMQHEINSLSEQKESDRTFKRLMQETTDEVISLPDYLKLYSANPRELMDVIIAKMKGNQLFR